MNGKNAVKKPKEKPYDKFLKVCQYYNLAMSREFFLRLKENIFLLDFESVKYEDMIVLGKGLKILLEITRICVKGKYDRSETSSHIHLNSSKSLVLKPAHKLIQSPSKDKAKAYHNFYNVTKLVQGLEFNVMNSSTLKELNFVGMYLSPKAWSLVNKALVKSKSLEVLVVNYCFLSDSDLKEIQDVLLVESLRKMNFSHNCLQNDCGQIIGVAISNINSIYTKTAWKNNLRGNENHDASSGLNEIIISHNKLDDKFLEILSHPLIFDNFIKAIDLSYNKFSIKGYQELLSTLQTNTSLIYLNLKGNQPTEGLEVLHGIIEKVLFNYENSKSALWANAETEWDQKIEEMISIWEGLNRPLDIKPSEKIKPKKKQKRLEFKRIGLGSQHTPLHLLKNNKEKPEKHCNHCEVFERELFKSKSQCVDLQIQNNQLLKKLDKVKIN